MGVREAHSLPSVDELFGHLPHGTKANNADLDAELERLADLRFQDFSEQQAEDDVALINAELDVYEMFAKEHCSARQRHIPLCDELKQWVVTLEDKLEAAMHQRAEDNGEWALVSHLGAYPLTIHSGQPAHVGHPSGMTKSAH
jgi:hypothetical protein